MTKRSLAARRVLRRQRWELRRWKLAQWLMGGVFGGPGTRPTGGLTIYATPSGSVDLKRRVGAVTLGLSVYDPGTRAIAEVQLTPQQAASLGDALLYWVQHWELPPRLASFGPDTPNICPHGVYICDECRSVVIEPPAVREL